jgi:penicillin-binding protein 2
MPPVVKNPQQEKRLINNRLMIAVIIVLVLGTLLLSRLFYLQIIKHSYYFNLSTQNARNSFPIPPRRGLIYDRNGILLAENIPVYSLMVQPSNAENLPQLLTNIQTIMDISPTELAEFQKQLRQHRPFDEIPLKLKLSEEEVAKFEVNSYQFPGFSVKAELIRNYPLGENMAHILGYVARINDEDLKHINQENYIGTNFMGKNGIEKYYEDTLHGEVGYQQMEVDAHGHKISDLGAIPAQAGKNIYLTIDSGLQLAAEKALSKYEGGVVVIQPSTGQVLAMVSRPSFDPNLFVHGISDKEYQALLNDEDRPLYDRTIRGLYPPGSTVKPIFALQGLDTGTITPTDTIFDPGYFKLPNSKHIFHDWKTGGHGEEDVTKAIMQSCDTFFFTLGNRMGIDNLDIILAEFGFGQLTNIDLPNELPGVVPSPAWKTKHYQTMWYPGDTINTSIGQGNTQVTLIQLADAAAALSMRGERFKPYLLYATEDDDNQKVLIASTPLPPVKIKTSQTWDIVINAMHRVISEEGTGWGFGIPKNYTAAGKTGTAQTTSIFNRSEIYTNVAKKLRPDSWIIVFAPVENPQIAIAVLVEHDPGAAASISRKVADYYFKHPILLANDNKK